MNTSPVVARSAGAAKPQDASVIYRQHGKSIRRWALRLGGSLVDADDIVQDVMMVVHRRLGEFRHEAQIETWLYKITQYVASARRRRERGRCWLSGHTGDYAKDVPAPSPTPLEEMERREASAGVHATLAQLADTYRETIVLFEIEGLSGEQVAARTTTSVQTVWVRLHRGRQQFRERYMKSATVAARSTYAA
jgi:RNA polymerase sigma-70 factor (ECF subfamily)